MSAILIGLKRLSLALHLGIVCALVSALLIVVSVLQATR
jgi:hypothetical protein